MPVSIGHMLWDGDTGGMQRAVYLLVREQLRDPVLQPAVMFARAHGPYFERFRELGCPVLDLALPNGHAVGRVAAAARTMRPFDILHFHSAEPILMASSLVYRGMRRVYTHRGGIIEYPLRQRVRYGATGVALRRSFHGLSGNTAHAARCASELFRIPPERFSVTYNGLEFDLLEATRTAVEVRRELGLSEGDFVLGTSANLKPWKRIERLLHLLVAIQDPAVKVLIVGDGGDRLRLQRVAAEVGVAERAIFAGMQSHVGDYLQVMSAFCLPSMGLESFGNAAVEAMGVGLPTIVFRDGGGTVEHIDHLKTGFIVDDQAELEAAVRSLRDDAATAARIGSNAREATRSRYTLAVAARSYRRLYGEALGPRGQGDRGHAILPSDET